MHIESIGGVIAAMRKDRKVTQEELADAVGVSAQAVSKWENGGAPDCALLPQIADFFGVSVDALFGRSTTEYAKVEDILAKKIMETPREEKLPFLYDLCWTMQRALFGDLPDVSREVRASRGAGSGCASEYRSDTGGHTFVGLDEQLPYFLLLTKSPALSDFGLEIDDLCALFRALSDRAVLDSLLLITQMPDNSFTVEWMAKQLAVSEEKSAEVLAQLVKYHYIMEQQMKIDNEVRSVYRCLVQHTSVLPALLLPAQRLIKGTACYEGYMGSRTPCMMEA